MKSTKNNDQTSFAKECIFTSLMLLMKEKDFEQISITDITKKAGVSRMSYYRNYDNKKDIIIDYLDHLFIEYINELKAYKDLTAYQFAHQYFIYFRKQEELMKNLIKADLSNLILERFDKYLYVIFKKIISKTYPVKINKYHISYTSGGLYKVLVHWINSGLVESDEEMAKVFCSFINNSSMQIPES
jgi:AcrR family transcriptional regulator